MTNLIENARSFVPGGTGRINVRLEAATGFMRIMVEDNGPGISADNIDRIFERFYTDRPSAEAFGQNSGLGLSISRQIIQAHGGSINAENIMDPEGRKGPGRALYRASAGRGMSGEAVNMHASAVQLAGQGVMILGASGSGKSSLALELLREALRGGGQACADFGRPGGPFSDQGRPVRIASRAACRPD